MKHRIKALLLTASLCSLPVAALPTRDQLKNAATTTLHGAACAASLYLLLLVKNNIILSYKAKGNETKAADDTAYKSIPAKAAALGALAYGTYYFGLKCLQGFGLFTEKPETAKTDE